jgi:hypothetical protein
MRRSGFVSNCPYPSAVLSRNPAQSPGERAQVHGLLTQLLGDLPHPRHSEPS